MNILNHDSIASEWLSGLDLAGKTVNVMIATVDEVMVPEPRTGKQVCKVAVTFAGAKKRLLLNATNAKSLAKLFGPETDAWSGRGVALKAENVAAFGQSYCVVRVAGAATVRMHKPAPTPAETPAPAPTQTEAPARASELYVPRGDDDNPFIDAPQQMAA